MNATFQSRKRSAISSPSSLQYRNSSRGESFSPPLKNGMRLFPSRWTLKFLPLSVVPFTSLSTRSGSPAAAAKVGMKSSCAQMSLTIVPGCDHAGPADQAGNAEGALPVGRLLAPEGRGAAIGPRKGFGAIVGRVNDDGVVGDAEVVEQLQQLADVAVGLHHAVRIKAEAGLALRCLLEMREDVHARRVEVAEPRCSRPSAAAR